LHLKLITAVSSTRFDRLYPGFVRELEFIIAVGRAEEADCLLRDLRQQPHFGQIDVLASTIHPAVFQELKKCARADSFNRLIRKRSKEFFEGLFAVRRDLVRLYAFERKYARLHELGSGNFVESIGRSNGVSPTCSPLECDSALGILLAKKRSIGGLRS